MARVELNKNLQLNKKINCPHKDKIDCLCRYCFTKLCIQGITDSDNICFAGRDYSLCDYRPDKKIEVYNRSKNTYTHEFCSKWICSCGTFRDWISILQEESRRD